MKKLVVGLAAAVLVVLGVAGGTVLAQSADEDAEKIVTVGDAIRYLEGKTA